jgi:hypothetical protein
MNTEVFLVPAPSKGYENVGWARLGEGGGGIPLDLKSSVFGDSDRWIFLEEHL